MLSLTLDRIVADPVAAVETVGASIARNIAAEQLIYYQLAVAILLSLTCDIVRKRDLRARYLSRGVRIDLIYGAIELTHIAQLALIVPLTLWYAATLERWAPWLGVVHLEGLPGWLQWLAVFVVTDFAVYWWHRAQHGSRWLWQFHKTHHSQRELNVFTTFRTTLLDRAVQLFVLALVAAVLNASYIFPLSIALVLQFHQLIEHSDTGLSYGPVDRLVVSPSYHEVHHSSLPQHLDCNFAGVLPVWDRLFGTYAPRGNAPIVYGLVGEQLPESWVRQQFVPLAGLWRLIRHGDSGPSWTAPAKVAAQ